MKRSPVAMLALAASTLVGIAVHEGYRGEAYIPVPGDVPTIGYGSTKGVKMGDRMTPVRSLQRLLDEVDSVYAQGVRKCVTVPLYQHEFSAFVSLTYNIGVSAFCKSTVVRRVNSGDYEGACDAILMWDKAGGKVLGGLQKRRKEEWKVCMNMTGNMEG